MLLEKIMTIVKKITQKLTCLVVKYNIQFLYTVFIMNEKNYRKLKIKQRKKSSMK